MTDISSITQSAYAQLYNSYSSYNLQQYSGLGLSESQRTQIRSIIRSATNDGLTSAQVQQQISSVLTPQQLSQLQSANSSASTGSTGTSTSTSSTNASSTTTGSTNPFGNLNLTPSEESQLEQLLQNAQSSGISLDQFNSQVSSILSPSQQATYQSDVQSVLQQINSAANSQAQQNGPPNPFNDPNGPFANLNLTSSQQSQIQQILQNAGSQGLSPDQVNDQINAVLTASQQTTFAGDLQSLQQQQQQQQTQSSQSAPPNPFTDPNGPFANLNLTSAQQSQIQQILQNAGSQGLSPDQVNDQINAVLTASQQSSFASDLQTLSAASTSSTSTASTAGTVDIFDNLNLTSSQKSEIQTILQNASSDGLSTSDVLTQIQSVLSASQQTTLAQNLQSLASASSGSRGHRSGGQNETDTQNQVAAANAAVTQFLQNELNTLGVTTAGSTSV